MAQILVSFNVLLIALWATAWTSGCSLEPSKGKDKDEGQDDPAGEAKADEAEEPEATASSEESEKSEDSEHTGDDAEQDDGGDDEERQKVAFGELMACLTTWSFGQTAQGNPGFGNLAVFGDLFKQMKIGNKQAWQDYLANFEVEPKDSDEAAELWLADEAAACQPAPAMGLAILLEPLPCGDQLLAVFKKDAKKSGEQESCGD